MAASRLGTGLAHRTTARVLVAAIVVFATVPALAQQRPLPQARIVVIGEGSATAAPDYAEITGGVTSRAKTAKEATDANARLMASVDAALVNSGIARTDIQTAEFSIEPVYAPPQPNAAPKLTGFNATNRVTVKIRQIATLGDILDRLIAAGATDIGNMQFLHSDPSKTLDEARKAAIADARRKAELYAQASGLTLGGVDWITEEPVSAPVPQFAARALAMAAPTPISPGEDTMRVQITVGFDVAR